MVISLPRNVETTSTNMKTGLKIPFNSNRTSRLNENKGIKTRGYWRRKKYGFKYFSNQAIRCEILATMGPVDARKSTINPVHGSSHHATYAAETKIQAVSPNSNCANSFQVMSSLIISMTLFSLYFILEQMTRCIIHLRISINIIYHKVMFVTSTLYTFFCTHTSAFKGSNNHRRTEQGLLPHILETTKTTRKQRKTILEKLERSCRSILEDILYTIDAQKIEAAWIVIGIAVSWRVLYGLLFYVVHRFYSKKDGE